MGLFTGDADGYGGMPEDHAIVKLNYPLDSKRRLIVLWTQLGGTMAGVVEPVEGEIKVSELIAKYGKK